MPTHYEVLGVDRDAEVDEIKRAYHRQARLYHPDAHASSLATVVDGAERSMQALNIAWNVLRDPARRRHYDRSLERPARTRGRPPARRLTLGAGFQYWLGVAGVHGGDTVPRYNLRVAGATSLAPLAPLAPDRLNGLHAANTAIGDDELYHLREMTGLRVLDLTGTRVTDVGVLHLQGCKALESLSLWDTAVTDASLLLLARLPNLRQLGLGNTRVTDAGLAHLRELTSLRLLQLWGTDVSGSGLSHLHGLAELQRITLPWRVRGRDRRRLRAALPSVVTI